MLASFWAGSGHMPAITGGEGCVRYAKAVSSGPMRWQAPLIGYISVNSLTARRVVQTDIRCG